MKIEIQLIIPSEDRFVRENHINLALEAGKVGEYSCLDFANAYEVHDLYEHFAMAAYNFVAKNEVGLVLIGRNFLIYRN